MDLFPTAVLSIDLRKNGSCSPVEEWSAGHSIHNSETKSRPE